MKQCVSLTLLLSALFAFAASPALAQTKQTYGWVEKIRLLPSQAVIDAKLDTGADHSSVNASNVQEYTKDGTKWVRFDIRNRYGKVVTIEQKVIGLTRIKRPNSKSVRRPVIRLPICLGKTAMEVDVNLAPREGFDYQVLIGRSFLVGHALIDPAVMYTVEPSCKGAGKS